MAVAAHRLDDALAGMLGPGLGLDALVVRLLHEPQTHALARRLALPGVAVTPGAAPPLAAVSPRGQQVYRPEVALALESALAVADVHGRVTVRPADVLAALLDEPAARLALLAIRPAWVCCPAGLAASALERLQTLGRHHAPAGAPAPAVLAHPALPAAIAPYAVDLTQQAREGRLQPVVGRERELRAVLDVLLRRRQCNPVLVGEAGVGKTAIVEGLALRIARGEVPPALRHARVASLDLAALRAGAHLQGEFEQRLRSLIEAAELAGQGPEPQPVILFIDELHTLVGAGGRAGTQDAANLLKPTLARGGVQVVGATTRREYKRWVEPDPALTRRFQPLEVHEPTAAVATGMVWSAVRGLETHHAVQVAGDAVEAAVTLTQRFLPERRLPDKAVAVLDAACARAGLAAHTAPLELELARAAVQALELELEVAVRDGHRGDIAALYASLDRAEELLCRQEEAWGEARLGPVERPVVGAAAVARTVSDWAGVPLERVSTGALPWGAGRTSQLPALLAASVVGQPEAVAAVASALVVAQAGLGARHSAAATLLFAGPRGVGKATLAGAVAEWTSGAPERLLRLQGADYREAHAVATLRGAPPGYVGFGDGGVLTEALRRRPATVVFVDDAELMHPAGLALFRAAAATGRLDDAEGVAVSVRDAVFILAVTCDADEPPALPAGLADLVVRVPFRELSSGAREGIVTTELQRVAVELARRDVELVVTPSASSLLARENPERPGVLRPTQELLLPVLAVAQEDAARLVVVARNGDVVVIRCDTEREVQLALEPAERAPEGRAPEVYLD